MKDIKIPYVICVLCCSWALVGYEAAPKTGAIATDSSHKAGVTTNPSAAAHSAAPIRPGRIASSGSYPLLARGQPVWVSVSTAHQRVYIKSGQKTLYTMVMSSGAATPKGVFHIEPERGKWFYSKSLREGAQYWVSFQGHGMYLFHSVPMDSEQHIIQQEAATLGEPTSHGCVRLSVSDAKWFYQHIARGTEVVVE